MRQSIASWLIVDGSVSPLSPLFFFLISSISIVNIDSPVPISVTEYIQEHLDRHLNIIELAAIAQISPYHLTRYFKRITGVTPRQFIAKSQ